MNDRDLRYFCKLVEVGNYTQTARFFQITQPAVSMAVKRLEADYGVPLLTQANNRSQLLTTPAGNVLYIHGRRLLHNISAIDVEVRHANEAKIRLGFSNIAGGTWLSKVFYRFRKYGLIDMLETKEAHSADLLDDLAAGRIDAAVFSGLTPNTQEALRCWPLETRQMCVIVSPNHPLAKKKSVSATDLVHAKFITRPLPALTRQALNVFCNQGHFRPDILFETDSNSLMQELVAQGMGVGMIIGGSVLLDSQLVTIPITEAIPCYMQLAVRKLFIPNAKQQQCLDALTGIHPDA